MILKSKKYTQNLPNKRIGIIQPGRIGDIVICLPIAKHYYDQGCDVVWPVAKDILNQFINHIDYVKFIPCEFSVIESYNICISSGCNNILDLSFRLPDPVNNFNAFLFDNKSLKFDELKYEIAGLPIETKYNLDINRDRGKENELYESLDLRNTDYCVVHSQGSDGHKPKIDDKIYKGLKVINISNLTDSIFDWIKVLQKANTVITIDSCFANLCNQLKLKQKKYFIHRPPPNPSPSITEDWIIYNGY